MTELERRWFEAGRRARRALGLPPPPSFYALLAAAVRGSRDDIPATEPGCRLTSSPSTTPGTTPANPRGEDLVQE